MKTAKEFAQTAAFLSNLASSSTPQDPAGRFATSEQLMIDHLRSAAAIAKSIAEATAAIEPTI